MCFRSIDKLNDFDQNRPTLRSSIKSQVLDLKTLPVFSPLKKGAILVPSIPWASYFRADFLILHSSIHLASYF